MSQLEWRRHEATIRRLYIDEGRPLNEVMETMKTKYSFDKKKHQYESQFRTWKLSKNKKGSAWELISHNLQVRKAKGLPSEVFYNGNPIPSSKVAKEVSRYRQQSTSNNELPYPPGFQIRAPIQRVEKSFLTANLPLAVFESSVLGAHRRPSQPQHIDPGRATSQVEAFQPGGPSLSDMFRSLPLDHPTPDLSNQLAPNERGLTDFHRQVVIPRLCSLVPGMLAEIHYKASSAQLDRELTGADSSMITQRDLSHDYIRLLILLLSNNRLNEKEFPLDKIWEYLRTKVTGWFPMIIRLHREDNPTASVLIRTIFRYAITRGEPDVLRGFLREGLVNPLADSEWSIYEYSGTAFRPLEYSLLFGSPAVTNLLYNAGFRHVDLNKLRSGASLRGEPRLSGLGPDLEILSYLVSKDASSTELPQCSLLPMLSCKFHADMDTVLIGLEAATPQQVQIWYLQKECTHRYLDYDEDQIAKLVGILSRNGIQVECHPSPNFVRFLTQRRPGVMNQTHPTRLREYLAAPQVLLEAARRGRHDILHEFVRLGGDIFALTMKSSSPQPSGHCEYRSVYSEAMRAGKTNLVNELETTGVIEKLRNEAQWRAAWRAALDTGNEVVLQKMLARVDTIHQNDIAVGLVLDALQAMRGDIAVLLISWDHQCIPLRFDDLEILFQNSVEKQLYRVSDVLLDRSSGMGLVMSTGTTGSSLRAAVRSGLQPLVQKVLSHFEGFWSDDELESGLETAVKQGDRAMVDLFLGLVGRPSGDCLVAAAKNGDLSMVEYLLQKGADPLDSYALDVAVQEGHMAIVKLLVGHLKSRYPRGVETYGSSALCLAIKRDGSEFVDYLIEQKIGLGRPLLEGHPLFEAISHVAKSSRGLDNVRKLLRAGFDPNRSIFFHDDFVRLTPILRAIELNNIPLLEVLVEHGASVAQPALGGLRRTPFQRATELGNPEIIQFFLNHGADINEEPALEFGATALQLASIEGWAGIVHFLLERGAKVNAPGARVGGRTALEGAAEYGRLDTVQLLINAGAGAGDRGAEQVSRALKLSNRGRHPEVWKMIKDHFQVQDCEWKSNLDWDLYSD